MEHVAAIRSVSFEGASGPVSFANRSTRESVGVVWGLSNIQRSPFTENASSYLIAKFPYVQSMGTWRENNDGLLVFSNGNTRPPELLRDAPDQNYLSNGLKVFGFVLFSLGLLLALVATGWTYWNRNLTIVRSSQPEFLFLLCLGCVISLVTIVVITFDDSDGLSNSQLGRLCMAIPWLISIGHSVTYGCLFMKLWRVNMVLSSSRRTVTIRRVLWPTSIMLALLALQLLLWTVLDPLRFVRTEIDAETGESVGECVSDHLVAWVSSIVVQLIIPSALTCYMAYRTIDVDESFSEARWIFLMIAVQLEAVLMTIPVVMLLRDVSSDGHYVSVVSLLWAFPVSTLLFLFVPKMIAHYNLVTGHEEKSKRGANISGTRVTGIETGVEST
jgi:7 transmembrane sweet-taste receptor of 3 GCPR